MDETDFTVSHEVLKVDDELGVVYGWASIVTKDGQPVIDSQGDIIEPAELVKAAHLFVTEARAAKVMHDGEQIGEIVESLVFTDDVQKALGVDLGFEGWFIGMAVPDDGLRKKVRDGELPMFSIGGRAEVSDG